MHCLMHFWTSFPKTKLTFLNVMNETLKELETTVQKCEEKRIFSKTGIFGQMPRSLRFHSRIKNGSKTVHLLQHKINLMIENFCELSIYKATVFCLKE